MAETQSFLAAVAGAAARRAGSVLAKVLALPLRRTGDDVRQWEKFRRVDVDALCGQVLDDSYAALVSSVIYASMAVLDRDFGTAFRFQNEAYNAVLDIYSNKDDNLSWIIPLLGRVSNDLRLIAETTDDTNNDINHTCLRESLGSLTKGFTVVAKDRTPIKQPGCKKIAIFTVTNVLFKIYFKVNTLQLCSKLISVVEGPGGIMDHLTLFPVGDVVMYKYYLGRLKMFEDRYEEARDCLSFALAHTPAAQFKNRQRILVSLLPVQMVLGTMPSQRVASTYQLPEFFALGRAAALGDLRTFDQLLLQHQPSLVRIGVYLVLEHVKMIAYRSFFRRFYLLSETTRLNLATCEAALRWMGQAADMDEIECVLCNLISQSRIKGYVSHEKRFLIVSKTDPFPKYRK